MSIELGETRSARPKLAVPMLGGEGKITVVTGDCTDEAKKRSFYTIYARLNSGVEDGRRTS